MSDYTDRLMRLGFPIAPVDPEPEQLVDGHPADSDHAWWFTEGFSAEYYGTDSPAPPADDEPATLAYQRGIDAVRAMLAPEMSGMDLYREHTGHGEGA